MPDAPTAATATAGDASASVSFTPGVDEGSTITGYTVTATDTTTPANGGQTASGASSPITVSGLTNGDSYTFTVTATNANGTGAGLGSVQRRDAEAAPRGLPRSPVSARPLVRMGTVVTIHGTNLENATVTFHGGVLGTLKKDTATTIKVHVPSGALNGKIVVTTPGGTAHTATKFKVT